MPDRESPVALGDPPGKVAIRQAFAALTPPIPEDATQEFLNQGYYNLGDLGASEAEVKETVEKVLAKGRGGDKARVVSVWRTAKDAWDAYQKWLKERDKPTETGPKPTPKPLDHATLQAGTEIDLTAAEVAIENVTWTIPDRLEVKPGKDFEPPTAEQWPILAKKTKLLYGLDLERVLGLDTQDQGGAPEGDSGRAPEAALIWVVPEEADFVDMNTRGAVTSTLHYTAAMSNMVRHQIMDGKLSVATPFAAGTARAMREERQASSSLSKRLFMTGMWRYTEATVTLAACTKLAARFVEAIDAALMASTPEMQFAELDRVFRRFGHAVPATVTLGGQLYFQSERVTSGTVEESMVKTVVESAAKAKYEGVAADTTSSFTDANHNKVSAQEIKESVSFICVGGNETLASTPKEWASTVKDPNKWAVIAQQGLTLLVDRLDKQRRERVLEVWEAGLAPLWGNHPRPRDYIKPDLENKPFTISDTKGKDGWALSSRVNIESVAEYDEHWWWRASPTPKGMRNSGIPRRGDFELRDKSWATDGELWAGVVGMVPATRLSNPEANGLLWRLVYTGQTTEQDRRGKPLYWIVAHPRERVPLNMGLVVLAAAPRKQWRREPEFLAILQDRSQLERDAGRAEQSLAAWTLTPVASAARREGGSVYALENPRSGRALGPMVFMSDVRHPRDFRVAPDDEYARPETWVRVSETGGVRGDESPTWLCSPYDEPVEVATNVMRPQEGLPMGRPLRSPDGRYEFEFQTDGNLVLYDTKDGKRRPLWASNTMHKGDFCHMRLDGHLEIWRTKGVAEVVFSSGPWVDGHADPGSELVVQPEGNVVIYGRKRERLWSAPPLTMMQPGDDLPAERPLRSPDRRYEFVFQSDGNLALYDMKDGKKTYLWDADTPHQGASCTMDANGYLTVRNRKGTAVWSTSEKGQASPGNELVVSSDGNVVIYNAKREPLWSARNPK